MLGGMDMDEKKSRVYTIVCVIHFLSMAAFVGVASLKLIGRMKLYEFVSNHADSYSSTFLGFPNEMYGYNLLQLILLIILCGSFVLKLFLKYRRSGKDNL